MAAHGRDDDPMAPGWMQHHEAEHRPELSTLLEGLKKALNETITHERADGSKALLKVKGCTVELGITWTYELDADVKFWVLDFTGKASREDAQMITVTLEPIETMEMFDQAKH